MRQLATYAFEAKLDGDEPPAQAAVVHRHIEAWLVSKGTLPPARDSIVLHDGRLASIEHAVTKSSQGCITEFVLTEPTAGGLFQTTVGVAEARDLVAVSVGLAAGSSSLSPVSLDVHCPRLLRDVLTPPSRWTYGSSSLTSSPVTFRGETGGDGFADLAWDQSRSVPVVAVSDEYGAVLHPGIVETLAADLAGLAIVARLDPAASWRLTARKGKEWSCYGGAMRLYWPVIDARSSPYQHPLWTLRRLLTGVADTETAGGRIRSQLRRRILGLSAFAVSEPALFNPWDQGGASRLGRRATWERRLGSDVVGTDVPGRTGLGLDTVHTLADGKDDALFAQPG